MSPGSGFFLAAILGVLSFPPIGLWPLSYIALVPFLNSAIAVSPKRAFRIGYVAGLLFFGGLLYWIGLNSGAPAGLAWASAVAVVAILALIWAITAWAVSRTAQRRSPAWAALLFVTLYLFFEVFFGTGEMGFPWAIWALSQTGFLPAIQMADLGDVYLVSLWVLTLNALIFLAWKRILRQSVWLWLIPFVFLLPLLYGAIRISQVQSGEPVAVAAVQANIPADIKWDVPAEDLLAAHITISSPLAETDTRLVVWPETAAPAPIRFRPWLQNALHAYCDSTGMYLLTGSSDYEGDQQNSQMLPVNAAFLVRPHLREMLRSAKMHLVPFGERIPAQKLFPVLGKLHLGQAEWVPAKHVTVFPAGKGVPPLGCLICFEVVFPDVAAKMVKAGATLLTTITNDGWYGNSSGPYQHLDLARLRAVAVRRSIVRSANTGISALILPTGYLRRSLGYGRAGAIFGSVPVRSEITPAARLASIWLPFYSIVLILALVALRFAPRNPRS